MDGIARFAAHVADTPFEALSPAAVAAAKTFLLDSLGVGLVGSVGPYAAELVALNGGEAAAVGSARVLGQQARPVPAPGAAFCNAYQIHNSEFDCVHEAAVVHPMAVMLGAILAQLDRSGGQASGRELLAAIALGVDVAAGIGVASKAGLRFFRPATAGGFGATLAVGRLMSFDAQGLTDAAGIAYSQMGGTMQAHTEGSPVLAMQVGFNARNAITACDMAAAGIAGPQNVLEGPFGYFPLFEGAYDLAPVLESLGRTWRIAEVAHKPFPSGRATHGLVDAALQLQRELGFAAADVTAVTAAVPPLTHRLIGRPVKDDMAVGYARLCGQYAVASALMGGGLGIADFAPAALADADRLDLARRVSIAADANPDPNALSPVTVTVRRTDGSEHARTLTAIYGNPANPMTRAAHLAKFRTNARAAARPLADEAIAALIALLDDLDRQPSTQPLLALIHGERP
ncbi:MAG: MmgE/PrpD family protein [Alphaproteobacteria bacterium]|nr:MmgE/PrpD family protein [Alphaproteobacteria bacterium]MCB9931123.1 MmgE/PrpD family protein [Alphaproteobacteria bacterium]